jgi:hypothetical protein
VSFEGSAGYQRDRSELFKHTGWEPGREEGVIRDGALQHAEGGCGAAGELGRDFGALTVAGIPQHEPLPAILREQVVVKYRRHDVGATRGKVASDRPSPCLRGVPFTNIRVPADRVAKLLPIYCCSRRSAYLCDQENYLHLELS